LEQIVAKAHFTRSQQLKNVTCALVVDVRLKVSVLVEEDGSFEIVGVKDDDLLEVSADAVRDAIDARVSDDDFAEAYATALEVEL
jgi:hypothetical protein